MIVCFVCGVSCDVAWLRMWFKCVCLCVMDCVMSYGVFFSFFCVLVLCVVRRACLFCLCLIV